MRINLKFNINAEEAAGILAYKFGYVGSYPTSRAACIDMIREYLYQYGRDASRWIDLSPGEKEVAKNWVRLFLKDLFDEDAQDKGSS